MTKPALITEAEGKRLARIAKAEGVAVTVKIGGAEITILPDIPETHRPRDIDVPEGCDL